MTGQSRQFNISNVTSWCNYQTIDFNNTPLRHNSSRRTHTLQQTPLGDLSRPHVLPTRKLDHQQTYGIPRHLLHTEISRALPIVTLQIQVYCSSAECHSVLVGRNTKSKKCLLVRQITVPPSASAGILVKLLSQLCSHHGHAPTCFCTHTSRCQTP